MNRLRDLTQKWSRLTGITGLWRSPRWRQHLHPYVAGIQAGGPLKRPIPASDSTLAFTPGTRAGLAVHLRGLSKQYADRKVLSEIDLDIAPGEFVAIVGRSGCGKSTLLRTLAGLETPTPGAQADASPLRFEGETIDIRLMFQDDRLLPWRRVLDNVALGLPASARARAQAVLADVGLAERSHDWPSRLSGGQKQRVALARALLHRPSLLLLDEPLGALDALTRLEMQALIENLWLQEQFTAVLVTHDVSEAVALADRVLVIDEGRIALDQRIDLPRPRSSAVPEFGKLEAHILQRVLRRHDNHADPQRLDRPNSKHHFAALS